MTIMIDGSPVTPWPCTLPRSFKKAVALLRSPYVRITEDEYLRVVRNTKGTDCVKWRDKVYTFGTADRGYRLMPIALEWIKEQHDEMDMRGHTRSR